MPNAALRLTLQLLLADLDIADVPCGRLSGSVSFAALGAVIDVNAIELHHARVRINVILRYSGGQK